MTSKSADSTTYACYAHNTKKGCEKKNCKYAHRKLTEEEQKISEKRRAERKNQDSGKGATSGTPSTADSTKKTCQKCGNSNHETKDCTFDGECIIARRQATWKERVERR